MILCTIAGLGLLFAAMPPGTPAQAESQVLESDMAELPPGTAIADDQSVKVPEGSTLRILVLSNSETKTIKGPYEGTIGDYKEELTWWERITGRSKDTDAPIGATRGLKAE
jgi:hypothetical protein